VRGTVAYYVAKPGYQGPDEFAYAYIGTDQYGGPMRVAVKGLRDPSYDEAKTTAYMKGDEITIRVDLGLGRGEARVWTCDLTKAYVEINGDYRS
jgi:N-acetylglutamate synthase/N-acetylornithine aminotransferase